MFIAENKPNFLQIGEIRNKKCCLGLDKNGPLDYNSGA